MAYGRNGYRGRQPRRAASDALVTPRQAAALDRMAEAHGFANGSALLASVASCTVAELGRQPRSVVQMFIDQAFQRYGRNARTETSTPAGASAWAFANAEAESMRAPVQAPEGADLRAVSAAAGPKYAYTAGGARMTVASQRCIDAPCCGCCD
jgi:hypothetical protein